MTANLVRLATISAVLFCGCENAGKSGSVLLDERVDVSTSVTKYKLDGKTYLIFRGGSGVAVIELEDADGNSSSSQKPESNSTRDCPENP